MSTPLPPKEKGQFNHVITLYETKQLRKAQKVADTILRKFPDHGETLAMKGLVLNALDRKEEAYALVRKGLAADMRSYVSWHVYGLLYRSDREYKDAAKAYQNALRINPRNVQILRDLALLQIQLRHYEAFSETRRNLLMLAPSKKTNWLAFAVSCHLLGNYESALKILRTYDSTRTEKDREAESKHEISELLLYEAMVLEESGDFAAALEHLEKSADQVVDVLGLKEARVRLLSALGRHSDAAEILRSLIAINPDNYDYQRNLHKEMAASEKSSESLLEVFEQLVKQYPHAQAPRRLALDLYPPGECFVAKVKEYVEPYLIKGIPSLFSDFKSLYSDAKKVECLGQLFESYEVYLSGTSQANGIAVDNADLLRDTPGALLWVRFYLAQHYDRIHNFTKALQTIDAAIAHTPTVIECYQVRARICKHAGALQTAADAMDLARKLDLADRYLNSKCVKYFLRAGRTKEAEALVNLFTRDGSSGGMQALYDMQAAWYELEAGNAMMKAGDYAGALKRFRAIARHYDDMIEDQFDFHTYCLRKVTLRSYVELLRMEDRLRQKGAYADSARGAFNCLMKIASLPKDERVVEGATTEEAIAMKSMTPSQRKKQMRKIKKRTAKGLSAATRQNTNKKVQISMKTPKNKGKASDASSSDSKSVPNGTHKKNSVSKSSTSETSNKSTKANPGWMEADPDGREYVKSLEDPVKEAWNIALAMEKYTPGSPSTWICLLEISIKRRKWLKALKSIRKLHSIDPSADSTVLCMAQFLRALKPHRDSLSPPIQKVLTRELDPLVKGDSVLETLKSFGSSEMGMAQAKLWMALQDKKDVKEAVKEVIAAIGTIGGQDKKTLVPVREAVEKLEIFKEAGISNNHLSEMKKALGAIWPLADALQSPVANGVKSNAGAGS